MSGRSLNTRGGTFVNMNVSDLFFFCLLAVCVILQTWGFTFSDKLYIGAVALAGILVLPKILASRYSKRELCVFVLLLGFAGYYTLRTRRYTVLLSVVLLIAAKDIDIRTLLKGFLTIKVFALVSLLALAVIGVFEVTTSTHYRMISGVYETRTQINGAATNILHLGYFTIAVLWLCLNYKKIRTGAVLVLLSLDIALYLTITKSSAGVALTALAILLIFACSRSTGLESLFVKSAPLAPFAFLAIMVLVGHFYGTVGFLDYVNRLSTGRIAYDHFWLTHYTPTLLGRDMGMLRGEGNFDDSFVFVLTLYGVFFAVMLYGAVTALLVKFRGGGSLLEHLSLSSSLFTVPSRACIRALLSTHPFSFSTYCSSRIDHRGVV